MISSGGFAVSDLASGPLVPLGFIFVCGVVGCALHVALQFSSTFLFSFLVVEEAFFFLVYILASLSVAG